MCVVVVYLARHIWSILVIFVHTKNIVLCPQIPCLFAPSLGEGESSPY